MTVLGVLHKSLPMLAVTTYRETSAHVYTCCDNPNWFHFYPNDTLWDGQQCATEEAPCCTYPNMPWFHKNTQ